MKLNKGALKLCAVYTVYCFALIALGYSVTDFKGRLYFNGLAYLPALLPFCWLGLIQKVRPDSWINTVFFFLSGFSRRRLLGRRDNQRLETAAGAVAAIYSHRRRAAWLAAASVTAETPRRAIAHRQVTFGSAMPTHPHPSLRAKRSNPCHHAKKEWIASLRSQ
ncbi:hypothetical protein [Bradyrhizobium sp. Ash2021]|uniref:hypothetical protein n=1 Tax=Bradyrhizobium sp. Ash2021 TaxID=2954771 RepID=UPI00281520F0|nr:hypothetical protein [Bradyrhizobium sp. Ash2021]WMT77637.1 hypothetical protein NL528_15320 [Bradyrhizobium sp. Ash2021]